MNNSLDAGDIHAVVQARDVHGGVHVHRRGPDRLVPAQLPPPPGVWADRDQELAALATFLARRRADDSAALVVITGPGGVGKTSVALRWLHTVRADYKDGQLLADLRGFSGGEPARPSEVLEQFLRALGVAPERVPLSLPEQAALFRTLTTGRRLIVLLDNARSAEQIQPLLPGAGGCLVVVTTRRQMAGLAVHGPRYVPLGPLEDSDAVELLTAMVGPERTGAEPEATRALAARCGGLPLAVCVSGAYLSGYRRHRIEDFAVRLAEEAGRLLNLRLEDDEMNDTSLHAAFTASYRSLPPEAQRLYRLLSVFPAEDIGTSVAAAAAGVSYDEANRLLDILIDRHLLEEPGILRFHDLARAHARDLAEQIDGQEGCRDALERIAEWMLRATVVAALKLNPNRWWLGRYFQPENRPVPADVALFLNFSDRADALEWLDGFHQSLFAVARQAHAEGLHQLTCEIVEAAWPLFTHRKLYSTWIDVHRLGADAAQAYGDVRMHARMVLGLSAAYNNLHEFNRAASYAREALDILRKARDRRAEASAMETLGVAEMGTGRPDEAIKWFSLAHRINRYDLTHPRGAFLMRRHIAEAHSKAGRYEQATQCFLSIVQFFTAETEPYLRARTLSGLANAYLHTGRWDEAEQALRESLSLCRDIDSHHEEANVLVMMARLDQHHGDTTGWRSKLESALSIYAQLDAPQVEQVTRMLADHR